MVNFPFKSLVNFLQIRSIATKSSKLVEPSLQSAAEAGLLTKPKTQKRSGGFLVGRSEPVVALFRKYQFTDGQIAHLDERSPRILRCGVESNLEPKLRFLSENGFEGSLLTDLVIRNPIIFYRSLSGHLIPNTEYLKELMSNDDAAFLFVVRREPWLLTTHLKKVLQPNIDLLFEEGVDLSNILKLLTSHPRTFLCSIVRMRYGIETIKKFGVEPTNNMYIHTLLAILSMSESKFKEKVEFLKSLGWSDGDITSTMARQPLCLSLSEAKLRSAFEFFVGTLHLKPEVIIRYPKLVTYSLEKRIIPRCKVIMALKEEKLMKDVHIHSWISISDEKFTSAYILKHPTLSPRLRNLYLGNPSINDVAVQR